MKKLTIATIMILFLTNISFSQNTNYKSLWKKVDKSVENFLPQQAEKDLLKIEEIATKEDNKPQLIRVALYRLSINNIYQEDNDIKNINFITKKVEENQTPIKNIYYSILGNLYYNYLEYNRYTIGNKVNVDSDSDDITSWSREDILNKIYYCYLKSVEDIDVLKNINLNDYKVILREEENENRKYLPTLYDFLAYNAIKILENPENNPLDQKIINKEALSSFNYFIKADIDGSYSFSENMVDVLQLYQNILKNNVDNATVFINADLSRLKFVYSNTDLENKDELYLNALFNLERRYPQHPDIANIMYDIANFYYENAQKYDGDVSDDYKDYFSLALAYCEKAVKDHPDSRGGKGCKYLKDKITESVISNIKFDKIIYPKEYFPIHIEYKNCESIYYKIVSISFDDLINLSLKYYNVNNKFVKEYFKKPLVKSDKIDIPSSDDYRVHNTELIIPALEEGSYLIFVSNNKDFDYDKGYLASSTFQVSDINLIISESENKNEIELISCDRNNGKPISNCNIQFIAGRNNPNEKLYKNIGSQLTTDKDGFVKTNKSDLTNRNNYYSKGIIVSKGDKKLFLYPYSFLENYKNKNKESVIFYTDRAIYRPGQIVHFKGIAVNSDGNEHNVIKNKSILVDFKDVNYSTIDSKTFITNEYGSFTGSFVVPNDVLNGRFTISTNTFSSYSSINFHVEEYKRPTFNIDFKVTTKQIKANKEVCLDVIPKTYSGAPLSNATVKYTITRTIRNYWYYRANNEIEISSGKINTDENGIANICFDAICPTKNYFYTPIYSFRVAVDVTDVSGETNSSFYYIYVSEKAMEIDTNIPNEVNLSNVKTSDSIYIKPVNINGDILDDKLNIKITKLKAPKTTPRPFSTNNFDLVNKTDVFVHSKDDYEKLIPKDIYKEEWKYQNWEKDKVVFDTKTDKRNFNLLDFNLDHGVYEFKINGTDSYGNNIEEVVYSNIYNNTNTPIFNLGDIKIDIDKTTAEPTEKVNVTLFSYAKNSYVKLFIVSKDRVIYNNYIKLNNNSYNYSFDVAEQDRGEITINATSIYDNRNYYKSKAVNVPFSNKKLDIELITSREENNKDDVLTPGDSENWQVKILNKDKGIKAELLAFMYDKSLDDIIPSNFNFTNYANKFVFPINYRKVFYINNVLKISYAQTNNHIDYYNNNPINYDSFLMHDNYGYGMPVFNRRYARKGYNEYQLNSIPADGVSLQSVGADNIMADADAYEMTEEAKEMEVEDSELIKEALDVVKSNEKDDIDNLDIVNIRTNFNETAFFYPQLKSDNDGNLSFNFTVPDAITQWQLYCVAHKEDLSMGIFSKTFVAKKEVFIQPNNPKIFFENDIIDYSARISNLSDNDINGTSFIQIFDLNDNDITSTLIDDNKIDFNIDKGENKYVYWTFKVPNATTGLLKIRVSAKTNNHTDAEEHLIPILTTKVLITESLPITVKDKGTNKFTFDRFKDNYNKDEYNTTSVTLEYTPNPVWNAIMALPYMDEGNDNFPNAIFNSLYVNLISSYIVKENPTIKDIFNKIKANNPEEFVSELEKNQELKNILINETPWVMDAKNEQEQRKRIELLFDFNKLSYQKQSSINLLKKCQYNNGGFPWIKGSEYTSFFTTLNIVEGFIHLNKLGIINIKNESEINNIITSAVRFLDSEVVKYYTLIKDKDKYSYVGSNILRYLYVKSEINSDFYSVVDPVLRSALNFFNNKLEKNWTKLNLEQQAIAALVLDNTNKTNTSKTILKSFNERALYSEELGMYWRDLTDRYSYTSSIETLSRLIECYNFIGNNKEAVSEMQRFLLNNKRTNMWETSKATAEAIFSLLMGNSPKIIGNYKDDTFKVGGKIVDTQEAVPGSGYIKQTWDANDVTSDFANITITKTEDGTSWGNVYWQYLTDYSNVTASSAGLSVKRQILKSSFDGDKVVYTEVTKDDNVKQTDKIVVRITLETDRELEFVHVKDLVPSCFIAKDLLSGFEYQNGLYYYKSIKDESINFFIDKLLKGKYVFEYPVNIQQSGEFNAGITKVQCMYAPEFGGQSEGRKLNVENDKK